GRAPPRPRTRRRLRHRERSVLRAHGTIAGGEPARAGAEVRGRGSDRRPGADGGRVVQLPPGALRAHVRDPARRRPHGAHRVPRLRRGTRHARALPDARPRPCRVARRRAGKAVAGRMSATASTGLISLFGLDPATYRPHDVHVGERQYTETNCYSDILIELLHARGDEPLAAMGFTVRMDFEGDQWTFFKPP